MAVVLSLTDEARAAGVLWDNRTLRVPKNTRLTEPLTYTATGDTPFTVELDANARLTLIETLTKDKSVNLSTTLTLGEKAQLQLISVGTESNINVQRSVKLAGADSAYREHDVFVGTGQQGFSIATTVENAAPRTSAEVQMHGVLDNAATASCTGRMTIPKGAVKARSRLAQHVLLLSPNAKAETFPYLEIEENDVQAGHAATVRPLDADSLFYLRSRGLPDGEARALLIKGFLAPFLAALTPEAQTLILSHINQKLDHALATQ
jgi:Fe-S cluster assembly scaffold protein SufB